MKKIDVSPLSVPVPTTDFPVCLMTDPNTKDFDLYIDEITFVCNGERDSMKLDVPVKIDREFGDNIRYKGNLFVIMGMFDYYTGRLSLNICSETDKSIYALNTVVKGFYYAKDDFYG